MNLRIPEVSSGAEGIKLHALPIGAARLDRVVLTGGSRRGSRVAGRLDRRVRARRPIR
jgi:hypothetical protein